MSTDVQGMLVRIEATTQQLRQELARAESAVGKTSQRIDGDLGRVDAAFDRLEESAAQAGSVVDSALTGITAATVASVAGLGALIATTAVAGKELTSLSFLANASTAEFQRMAAGARSAGVDQGKLADVLKDVNDRVGEFASTGGGEMKDFFEQIAPKVGVTVQQFQKLSGPQALQLYYDSLEKAGLNQQEMTFYMEAMADEATALIPLLANGGKGFQEMGDRAERLGVVLSDLELSQLAELSKIAGEAGMAWEGVTNQLVAGLQPAISALVESLDGEGFSAAAQDMGDGIRFVIDNLDALVIALGSLGAGRLAIRFVEGVQAISGYVQSVRQATEAERIHTQAVQASALEQVRRAEGELNAARIQAISTRGTVEHTAALSRQRQAKLDLAVANQAYTAAQTAANAVTGTATTLLRGALGLFGGPVGLVTMIGTAAAGWLLFADNSDKARQATLDLTQPVEALRREIEALTLAQANSRLLQLEEGQKALRGELEDTTEALAAQVVQYDYWGNRFTVGQREAGAAWAEFMAAVNRGDDIGQAAIALADATGASAEMRAEIISTAAEMETQRGQIDQNAAAQAMLEGHMRSLTDATRENTAATGENTGSKGGNTDAAQKYLEQLQKQLNAMRDKTALQAAERFLTENSITAESELGQQILATATAKDRQREADTAATAARKSSTKAVKDEAKELQSLLDKLLPAEAAQREQVETIETLDEAWQKGRITLEQYSEAMSAAWAAQSKAEWDKANKAQEELNKTLKASNDAFEQLEDQLDPVRAASKRLAEQQKILRAEYDRGEISLERYNALLGRAQVEYDGVAKEASAWVKLTADAFERVNAAGADMWYEFFDTGRVTFDSLLGIGKRWAAEMANALTMRGLTAVFGGMLGMGGSSSAFASLGGALGGGGGGGGLLDIFNAGKTAYGVGTSGFGQAIAAGWNGGQGFFGGLQGAASGAWNYGSNALGGLFGGGTAGSSIADYTGAAFSNWAAGGSQALGASQAGYTGAQFSNWVALQNAGNWGMAATSLGSILGGVGGALYGYGQSGWKGAATGALGGWGGATLGSVGGAALGTAIGGTLGSVVPVIGTAIGAALGSWLGGSLFSGDWQTKDAGLAFSVADGDFLGQQFEYQKKKGGLFSSNKKRFVYSELDEESAAAFQSTFDSVELGVADLFERLSFTVEDGALAGLQLAETRISTAGKTEEEIQQAIAEWFGNVGEAMNAELNRVFSTGLDYDLAGMTAFVNNLYAVNDVLRYLDVGMYETDVAGGKLAEQLSALAGGFDALQTGASVYYDQFFSATEKAEDMLDSVTRAFKSAEQALPGTRDEFRSMIEAIDITTEAGQSMFSTLMGLAGQADAYYDIIESNATSALAAAAAAQQALLDGMAVYYDQFTTEARKAEDALGGVKAQFSSVGLTLPSTREAFIALVDGLDTTTEAGQKLFATLMGLAGAADTAYDITESLAAAAAEATKAALNGALSGLSSAITAEKSAVEQGYQRQAEGIRSALDSTSDSVASLRAAANTLRGTLGRLRLDSEQYAEQSRRSAQETVRQAIYSGGRVQMTEDLERALDTVSQSSERLFGSFEDYARDYWQTYFAIEALADRADDQLSVEEQAVKALERQLNESQRYHDEEIARLDGVLEGAEAQLEALLGIDTRVQSVEAALAAFTAALSAAQQLQNANSSITSVTGLGGVKRQVTSEGYILDELGNQMELFGEALRVVGNKVVGGAGATLNIGASGQLSWASGDYEEWAKQVGIPGFASGGMHAGGLRLVGERGPELEVTGPSRIYSASQTAALLGGGTETASEVRALRTEVAGLRSALVAIAKYTESTAYGVRQMNEIGLPQQEVV